MQRKKKSGGDRCGASNPPAQKSTPKMMGGGYAMKKPKMAYGGMAKKK